MPNRILKNSICKSETIKQLTWFEEVFFYRLIVNCDDYGRADARIDALASDLFPIRRDIALKNIEAALNKLVAVGLVHTYEYDGQPYLQLPSWEKHQTVRNQKSKFPPPTDFMQLKSIEINCIQPQADVAVIQSESESESENENESENESVLPAVNKRDLEINEVILFFNATVGTDYRLNGKETRGHVNARLEDGYTVDDFKAVITKKNDQWGNDPKMSAYLRPKTLFTPSNFESYLNQPAKATPQQTGFEAVMQKICSDGDAIYSDEIVTIYEGD